MERIKYATINDETIEESVQESGQESINDPSPTFKPQRSTKETIKTIVFFLVANFLYILSDQKCPYEDPTTCAKEFIFPNLPRWAAQIFISALLFTIIICKGMNRTISRFYILGVILNVAYLCFFFNPVLSAQVYGQMFAFFLALCLFLCLFAVGCWLVAAKCYRKSPFCLLMIPAVLLAFGGTFYLVKVRNSCQDWTKGIGGEEILADGTSCTVQIPPVCAYEITSGWLDLSRFKSCASCQASNSIMEKYFPHDAPVIGYPRTEPFTDNQRLPIQKSVLDHLVPLSGLNDPAAANLEIFLDRESESNPGIKINVKRNEALVEERAKIQHEGLAKNVLVIYIDALSRVNAMRKLPKTMSWFESYMNKQNPDAEAFQFFKYHTTAPFTFPNLYESLYGVHPDDPSLTSRKPLPSYLKHFKDNGYITGHATDFCQTSPLDILPNQGIKDIPYDHEAISFACDPHYHDPNSPYGIFNGPYASMRRCLYGKDVFEYVYEYGNQFWRTYKDEKKLLYLDFLVAHEGTGEVVKYMDDALFEFLDNLKNENLLEDTAVVLYADHGLHMQGLFYLMNIEQVFVEISLPALYTVLPKQITKKYGEDVKTNQQRLVSAHELHNFFISVAEGDKSEKVQESLLGSMGASRTCDDIRLMGATCVCKLDEKH